MLRSRDQAIVLVEFTTSASAVSAEGTWGRNAAGVGTGRRPPEAARRRLPPGAEHGSRREEPTAESTLGNRSGRPRFRRADAMPGRLPCLE
jgi:hypothetical protein